MDESNWKPKVRRIKLLSLIAALKVGPPASRVTDVRVEWVPATGRHADFAVWY